MRGKHFIYDVAPHLHVSSICEKQTWYTLSNMRDGAAKSISNGMIQAVNACGLVVQVFQKQHQHKFNAVAH